MSGKKPLDVTGHRYGMLVALEIGGQDHRGRRKWLCQCDCGNIHIASLDNLRRGVTKSCGCLVKISRVVSNTTHGMSHKPIFKLWENMLARCYSKSNPAFYRYGGRGITVCDRWHKFENFYEDMGDRPLGMSLDRINNDDSYSPENCRWATNKQQGRNQRTNRLLTFRGETKCMSAWCEELGLMPPTVCNRLNKLGWSVEKALSTQVSK